MNTIVRVDVGALGGLLGGYLEVGGNTDFVIGICKLVRGKKEQHKYFYGEIIATGLEYGKETVASGVET